MAAAHVSGVVALLLERRPNLSPPAVAELLAATARPAGGAQPAAHDPDADGGAEGVLVDACGAVAELIGRARDECATPVGLAVHGGGQ
jgi:subtilisin family serine protease